MPPTTPSKWKDGSVTAGLARLRLRSTNSATKTETEPLAKKSDEVNENVEAKPETVTPSKKQMTLSERIKISPSTWIGKKKNHFKPETAEADENAQPSLKATDSKLLSPVQENKSGKPKPKNNTNVKGAPKSKPTTKKSKKSTPKKEVATDGKRQTTIYEHFQVRRSDRRNSKDVQEQKRIDLENKIRNDCTDGLEVIDEGEKGLGVLTTHFFYRGDFVCEYAGDLISKAEADEREEKYGLEPGCYMYYFKHELVTYCVDATKPGPIGRLINHGSKNANLQSKVVSVDSTPRLCFFALKDIPAGTALKYDYGDRRKDALASHPWLAE